MVIRPDGPIVSSAFRTEHHEDRFQFGGVRHHGDGLGSELYLDALWIAGQADDGAAGGADDVIQINRDTGRGGWNRGKQNLTRELRGALRAPTELCDLAIRFAAGNKKGERVRASHHHRQLISEIMHDLRDRRVVRAGHVPTIGNRATPTV